MGGGGGRWKTLKEIRKGSKKGRGGEVADLKSSDWFVLIRLLREENKRIRLGWMTEKV